MIARTPAPKAEDYSVVPGSLGPRRDFRISVGLREGWDADGRVFDVSEAVRTARPLRHVPPCGSYLRLAPPRRYCWLGPRTSGAIHRGSRPRLSRPFVRRDNRGDVERTFD